MNISDVRERLINYLNGRMRLIQSKYLYGFDYESNFRNTRKKIKFKFDNLTYNQFRIIGSKPNDKIPMFLEKYPIGESITLITSNMPEDLKEEIIKLISQYCGH